MDSDLLTPITGDDTLWDGSTLNPLGLGINTSLAQIFPVSTGLSNDLSSDLVPNRSVSIPVASSSATRTYTRPADNTVSNVTAPNF